jgi:fructoselysine 6-kinase
LDAAQSAGVELIAITHGSRGATVCHKGETRFVSSVPTIVIDTLGAGDAFVSRLACRVLCGVPLVEAAGDAARYSALICSSRGAFGHARHYLRSTNLRAP